MNGQYFNFSKIDQINKSVWMMRKTKGSFAVINTQVLKKICIKYEIIQSQEFWFQAIKTTCLTCKSNLFIYLFILAKGEREFNDWKCIKSLNNSAVLGRRKSK